jgi:hypothetical protein
MTRSARLLRSFLALAAFLAAGEAALAQSPMCQRYRAELAALDRGGGRQAAAAADRQRAEIGRLVNYYRSIGCERGPFGLFGGSAPAECGSISQRIRQMEANYASLVAQSGEFGNLDARRRQLQIAIEQTCAPGQQEADNGPRGFFESLFGPPRGRPPEPMAPNEFGEQPEEQRALGGRRLVCVRTCDGFFFPLSNAPGGRENADEMCQALCPGTETAAFAMPGSDDALDRAVSLRGKPYTSLATAFKFQKSFDNACACKKDKESWAQILRRAESMLEQKRGDIIVTAQKAEELSRPKVTPVQAKKPVDKKASDAAETQEAADLGAAAPTASRESSGIGPQSIETSRVIGTGEGPKQEAPAAGGAKRTVRIIAPNIIPVPHLNAKP